MSILYAILIFGFLIFFHELGHYLVARAFGVTVIEFAIGMGPKLLSWKSKKSGILYSIRILPLGGYCAMEGENDAIAQSKEKRSETTDENFFDTSEEGNVTEAEAPSDDTATEETEKEKSHNYSDQNVWVRMLICAAGPFMNLLLGFLLMLGVLLHGGPDTVGTTVVGGFHVQYAGEAVENGLQPGDLLYSVDGSAEEDGAFGNRLYSLEQLKAAVAQNEGGTFPVRVMRLSEDKTEIVYPVFEMILSEETVGNDWENSLSERAGLKIGDEVVKINNVAVHTYSELSYQIMFQGYREVTLTVKRDGEKVKIPVHFPTEVSEGATFGTMDFLIYGESEWNVGVILKHTFWSTVSYVRTVIDSFKGLFIGRFGVEAVSGPIGITKVISQAADQGWTYLLNLVVMITVNLGIANLFPIPGLDGGHLLIYVIEVIRRKPMKKELEGVINFVGLALMLALAVIIAVKDIINL